jgi:asparagine synthase (glutamine-hydrolysing)
MAAFIHGEVNWESRPQLVESNVRRMTQAGHHYPWAWTSINDASAGDVSCVLGVQRGTLEKRDNRPEGGDVLSMVSDLDLHGRDVLESQLGISAPEALSLNDEALIRRAYRLWGVGCAERILGEGALALWDGSEQRLVCWRDAAGVRPLYYHHVPGRRVVISSDLQSMASHPEIPSKLDLAYTKALLFEGSFQHPVRTLVEGVQKVPAGHLLLFDRRGLRIQRYWDPAGIVEREQTDDGDYVDELRALLRQAVSSRLPKEGGIGAHLSGGLDSSSVALIAASLLNGQGEKLTAFSWAPPRDVVPEVEGDERDLAEAVSRFGGVPLRYTTLQPSDVVDYSYRDVALRPRSTLNFEISTSRQAREAGIQTMLSGWGGDELIAFNGRGYFAELALRGRFATIQRELRLRSQIHGGNLRGPWKARVLRPLLPDRMLGLESELPPLPAELRPEFARLLADVEPLDHVYPRERAGVRRMQVSLFEFGHLQYRMESWAAHGAAIGLRYSFPLLDRRIMEFALSLPGRMFFQDGWKRWLYRTAMEGVLPDVVRWNPQKFDNAAEHQLRNVLRNRTEEYRRPLLERNDSPLVDVQVLLAEQDRQWRSLDASEAPPAHPYPPVGAGAWLAFTELNPG